MAFTFKQLTPDDVVFYSQIVRLYESLDRARWSGNSEPGVFELNEATLRAHLALASTIELVALEGEAIAGGIGAFEYVNTEIPLKEIFIENSHVNDGFDTAHVFEELLAELKHIAHLCGANNLYVTHHGDNRDIPIRIPPLRKHCAETCKERLSPDHCLRHVKH